MAEVVKRCSVWCMCVCMHVCGGVYRVESVGVCVWACSGMGDGVCVLGLVEVLQTHTYIYTTHTKGSCISSLFFVCGGGGVGLDTYISVRLYTKVVHKTRGGGGRRGDRIEAPSTSSHKNRVCYCKSISACLLHALQPTKCLRTMVTVISICISMPVKVSKPVILS